MPATRRNSSNPQGSPSRTQENTITPALFCSGGDDSPFEAALGPFSGFVERMWPNGKTLTYCFMDGYQDTSGIHPGSPAQRRQVAEVIREWERYANVKFELTDDQKSSIIRIVFNSEPTSWSRIGRQAEISPPEKPTMNLRLDGDLSQQERETGVILHEFGHALGLGHEHRPPQDGYHLWVDDKSIMMNEFSPDENQQGRATAPNNKLSELDKAYVALYYPFEAAPKIQQALEVIGVDETYREAIIRSYESRLYDEYYWRDMRSRMQEWIRSKRSIRIVSEERLRIVPRETQSPTGSKRKRPTKKNSGSVANGSEERQRDPRFWLGAIPLHAM